MAERRWAFVCALALLVGCEALFPLDDLGGPRPALDGGGYADTGARPADATTDALRAPDAAEAATDAGVDVAPDACAGFCPCLVPAPSFCDDFEEGDLRAWSTITARGGTASVVADASVSPPRSLRIDIPPVDAGGRGYVQKDFSVTTMTQLRLEFDMSSPQWTDDQAVAFEVANDYSVALVFSDQRVGVFEEVDGGQVFNPLGPAIAPNVWQHVVIVVRLGATPTISLSYGDPDAGAAVYTQSIQAPALGKPTFDLGGVYIQNSPMGWHANFDNVTLRFQ
jgi:hypothetical protein